MKRQIKIELESTIEDAPGARAKIKYTIQTDAHGLWIILKDKQDQEIGAVRLDSVDGDLTASLWNYWRCFDDPIIKIPLVDRAVLEWKE